MQFQSYLVSGGFSGITVYSRNLTGRTKNNNLGSLLDLKTILKIEILEIISQTAKRVDIYIFGVTGIT